MQIMLEAQYFQRNAGRESDLTQAEPHAPNSNNTEPSTLFCAPAALGTFVSQSSMHYACRLCVPPGAAAVNA